MELIAKLVLIYIPSALALYFLIQKLTTHSHHGKLPPGPRPFPIVGSLPLLGDKPHRSLASLAKKAHGPLMSVKLGSVTTIVASSPATAREVLKKKDILFCCRSVPDATRAHRVNEASVVWLPANHQWRSLRKICNTQLFMSQRIINSEGLRRDKVRELVEFLKGREGEAVDVGQAAFETVLNLISNTLFSIDMVDLGSESGGKFKDLVWAVLEESGRPNISDFFPVIAGLDLQGRRRRTGGYLGKLRESFDEVIEQRMSQKTSTTNDFLDSLISSDACGDDPKMNRHAMKSLLGDLFIAGTDTSSHTLEWAMTELLRRPSSMAKAQAELWEVIGPEKKVDESDIHRLPYLQAVVKETLRLHPPTPLLLPRRAEATVELFGYTIVEGARVLVNVWAIGRDPNVWTDPEQFIPDRFLESKMDYKGQDFELLPFGSGRRICPGLPLAFRMVHLMLASLLQSFNWRLPDEMKTADLDMEEKFGLTLAKVIPLHAVPLLKTS